MKVYPTDDLGRLRCVLVDPVSGRQCVLLVQDHLGVEHDYSSVLDSMADSVLLAAFITVLVSPRSKSASVIDAIARTFQEAVNVLLFKEDEKS